MRLTCTCGFTIEYTDKPPSYGFVACEECGARIEVNPLPIPPQSISFAGASELDAGAAEVRALVERIRKG